MAASYQPGTAPSPTNLLQQIVTWLVAQGWTQNMSQADGAGWRAHLSKAGVYVNLRATPGNEVIWVGGNGSGTTDQIGIALYLSTAWSSGNAWNAQTGGPIGNGQTYTVGCFMQLPVGAITGFRLFDDGADNIAIIVERTTSIFTHMGWGPTLAKVGTWTGGAYFFAAKSGYGSAETSSFPGTPGVTADGPFTFGDATRYGTAGSNSFVRCDVDSFTGKWLCNHPDGFSAPAGYTGRLQASGVFSQSTLPPEIPQYGNTFQGRQTSAMNSQVNLLPVRIFAARDAGGYSLIGDVPNLYFSNGVGNGFAAGAVYPIGSENYMMFPKFAVRKWA